MPGRTTPRKPRPAAKAPAPKLRLLKVLVQPVFVVDDGKSLKEASTAEPMSVTGAEWHAWAARTFTPAHLAKLAADMVEREAGG